MLTETMIAKLESKGFKRWTKGTMDRLYIDASKLNPGCGRYASKVKTYIDVMTGELVSGYITLEELARDIYDDVIAQCSEETAETEADETEADDDDEGHTYSIVTEVERQTNTYSKLGDAVWNAEHSLPLSMSWEIRDENEEVVYSHYVDDCDDTETEK